MGFPTKLDWLKIPRILDGTWPENPPNHHSVLDVDLTFMDRWFAEALNADYVAIDTEFYRSSGQLWLLGIGYPGGDILHLEWLKKDGRAKSVFLGNLRGLIQQVPVVFHNALADVEVINTRLR